MLDACLKNRVYDWQVEGSKAVWLYEMVKDSAEFPLIRTAVLDALKTETYAVHLDHLFIFSAEMVSAGDVEMLAAMRSRILEIAPNQDIEMWAGQDAYVGAGGIDATLELVHTYGQLLGNKAIDGRTYGGFCDYDLCFDEESIDAEVLARLPDLANGDAAYAAYQRYREWVTATKKEFLSQPERKKRAFRNRVSLNKLFADTETKTLEYPGYRTRFGKLATQDQLQQIYEKMLAVNSKEARKQLLWVFRQTLLPSVHDRIIEWAQDEDDGLRGAAISALKHSADYRVRELALAKLSIPHRKMADSGFLSLFIHNYEPGDSKQLLDWLSQQELGESERHNYCMSLLDIAEKVNSAETLSLLLWSYHNTPCMYCRHKTLKQYLAIEPLPPEISAECRNDAKEEIRQIAVAKN